MVRASLQANITDLKETPSCGKEDVMKQPREPLGWREEIYSVHFLLAAIPSITSRSPH